MVPCPRNNDDGNARLFLVNVGQHFQTVHSRHLDVEQHQVDALFPGRYQGARSVGGEQNLVRLELQQSLERIADTLFVVRDQDGFLP